MKKEQTFKELHFSIFRHLRHIFSEWADITDPNTSRTVKSNLRNLIAFPYRKQDSDPQMTKEEFDALSDEEAFQLCFKGVVDSASDEFKQSSS